MPGWHRFSALRLSRREQRMHQGPPGQPNDDGRAHPGEPASCPRDARGPCPGHDFRRSGNKGWLGCQATRRRASVRARKANRPARSATLPFAAAFWSVVPTRMLQRFRSVIPISTNHRGESTRRQAGSGLYKARTGSDYLRNKTGWACSWPHRRSICCCRKTGVLKNLLNIC